MAANQRMTELAATVGLEYHLDQVQIGNTFDAHRLIHLAAHEGRGGRHEGAAAAGLLHRGPRHLRPAPPWPSWPPRWDWTPTGWPTVLDGDEFADEVRADEARAMELGSTGVPFFVFDERLGRPGCPAARRPAAPAAAGLGHLDRRPWPTRPEPAPSPGARRAGARRTRYR